MKLTDAIKTLDECGEELVERFYTYRDNFLQLKYFEQLQGFSVKTE
jgi:hypothetical protein